MVTRRLLSALSVVIISISVNSSAFALDPSEDTLDLTITKHFYKDPVVAFRLALFPGFLLHGRGLTYAGDRVQGAVLMAGEAISVLVMGLGILEKESPESFRKFPGNKDDAKIAESSGRRMLAYGAVGFAITWVADMAASPWAAARYNAEHNLEPSWEWRPEGMRLGMTRAF